MMVLLMASKVKETPAKAKRRKPQRPREPGKTTISSKNQITLPVNALREAGLVPGTRLEVFVGLGGEIRLLPADESRLERLERGAGSLTGLYEPGYLEELRRGEP